MQKPLRPCKHPACRALTGAGYCEQHRHLQQQRESNRKSSYERGYTSKWAKASKTYLSTHPWCAECARQGRHEPATETDHIKPHRGDMKIFWDKSNWQGLCRSCHSKKTAREDGGFGNGKK